MKKSLPIIITGIILFGFTGCRAETSNIAITNVKTDCEAVAKDNHINLNNLKFTLPTNWTKRGNENEIFFDNESKQTVGGISLIGYYGDYNGVVPNHSKVLNSEDINTSLGKGKLFTLSRSNPAANKDDKTWNEIHVVIPSNADNLAFDFWAKESKEKLLNILKTVH